MASTTFIDNQTTIYAAWLNDVNNAVYNGIFVSPSITATSMICTGTASGTGFTNLINNTFASPAAIGNATPNTGAFTTLTANSLSLSTTPLGISSGGIGLSSVGTSGYALASNGSALVYKKLGLGMTGETWHATSNSQNNTYTNSRSYPIMVAVNGYMTAGGYSVIAYVDGVYVAQFGGGSGGSQQAISFIVPSGSTYQVTATAFAQAGWSELY
jgi:hypothetical protein